MYFYFNEARRMFILSRIKGSYGMFVYFKNGRNTFHREVLGQYPISQIEIP
jgi:hypothetical protein